MDGDLELRIGKLHLGPGDVLAIQYLGRLSPEGLARIQLEAKRACPGIPLLIIDDKIELSVVSRDALPDDAKEVGFGPRDIEARAG